MVKNGKLSPKMEKTQGCLSPLLFSNILEDPVGAIQKKKSYKGYR